MKTWMREFLHQCQWGTMGLVADEKPFLNVNLYYYDEEKQALYFHTAREGRTRFFLEPASEVIFNISEMGRLLPAKMAQKFQCGV